MASYKSEVTLNEKDSLMDLLNLEKSMVKVYATAITEGCSKGFRNTIKDCLSGEANDQFNVFLMLTDKGYAVVESEQDNKIEALKEKFTKVKGQLS